MTTDEKSTHEKLDHIIRGQEDIRAVISHLTDTLGAFCDRLTEALREKRS